MLAVPNSEKLISDFIRIAKQADEDSVFDVDRLRNIMGGLHAALVRSDNDHDKKRISNAMCVAYSTIAIQDRTALVARLLTIASQYLEGAPLFELTEDLMELGFLPLW